MLLCGGTQEIASVGVLQLFFLHKPPPPPSTATISFSIASALMLRSRVLGAFSSLKTTTPFTRFSPLFSHSPKVPLPPPRVGIHHQPSSKTTQLTSQRQLPHSPLPASSVELHDQRTSEDDVEEKFVGAGTWGSDREFRTPTGPLLEVRDLEELPEQWKRSKVAWLCKILPSHKPATLIRLLNSQRKWMAQEEAKYIIVHFLRIRENDASFRVYKWMVQQRWFQFDFALATNLADHLGKERKYSKCRELFDDIVNRGQVPCESTFHILIIAYIGADSHGCLEEACVIYNRMIQLGGYRPSLSLHNALFRALVSKPGGTSKYYLKQAEFIYHNLESSKLEIQGDIYAGLIWLHSYQDNIDKERVAELRREMQQAGLEESRDVLVSILRICSKEGDVDEAERIWKKLLNADFSIPSQAFVYRMELFAKLGEPMKSLEEFRRIQEHGVPNSIVAYHKIIEVMSKAQEAEIAETIMDEFRKNEMKPLLPAYVDLMNMYLDLSMHDKVESAFVQCSTECRPNRTVYNVYLESLVQTNNLEKAEEVFIQMQTNGALGANDSACNIILQAYLDSGQHEKAEQIYDLMCRKKYEIKPSLIDKLDYMLSSRKKVVKKPIRLKLEKEQREVLIGLLLGGAEMEMIEQRNHLFHFEFKENSFVHGMLKMHIQEKFFEWLDCYSRQSNGIEEIPYGLSTIPHSSFGFFADQFWPKGRPMIPKLIHRWLSPRVLAYWYMYGGHKSSKGDVLLRIKGTLEDVERLVKALKMKSIDCKVKRKGKTFWLGCQNSNAIWFWKLVEPYILPDLKGILNPEFHGSVDEETSGGGYSGSDTDSGLDV
ncbi:pentatricopeptide repeat-containing protein OTP51, chloroplastic [Nymphaea colorata]|nr:pentatricopeptide repeat-containing protein OTP51, chloroplastic [Nymphaea colorata]